MHYCNMSKEQIWETTLPQLKYLMRQCGEHIDFTVQVASYGMPSFLGGSSPAPEADSAPGDYEDGYKVATAEDMEWLGNMLGA